MIDELELIERLENIQRLLEEGSAGSAQYVLRALIDERIEIVERFELEMQEGMNA